MSFGVIAAQALEDGRVDGFWANGMGAELAVRRGVGTVVIDARRDAGMPDYTMASIVASDQLIKSSPDAAAAAVRAIVKAQKALKADPSLATGIADGLFPSEQVPLIADLIARDAPFYDANISQQAVEGLNKFANAIGLIAAPVPYDHLVASQFRRLWSK